ncbi:MAG: thioredoxin family protein [Cyanobacteria bacterium SZAS-4]|nr:thioredoxin family protein [Cyanobacteria bacterium SZAS-4]
MTRPIFCSILALVSAVIVGSFAIAAPTAQEAINDYNSGKYLSCLQKLQALNLKNNATAHYYIALCAQNLNRMTEAKAEYNWVISNGQEPLRSYAQKGLANLDKLHTSGPSTTAVAATAAAAPAKAAVATTGSGIVKKIIDFSTTWCGPCQAFKPHFEEAKNHFKDISFVSLDGDDAANAAMKEKYNVSAYPTLVYLDGSGKVLKNEAGAPNSLEDFESMIKELNNPKR